MCRMLITFHILYKKGQKFVNSNIYYKLNSERISKQTKKIIIITCYLLTHEIIFNKYLSI